MTAKAARKNYENHKSDESFNFIINTLNDIIKEKSQYTTEILVGFNSCEFKEIVTNEVLRNRVLNALKSVGYKSSIEVSVDIPSTEKSGVLSIEW